MTTNGSEEMAQLLPSEPSPSTSQRRLELEGRGIMWRRVEGEMNGDFPFVDWMLFGSRLGFGAKGSLAQDSAPKETHTCVCYRDIFTVLS